MTKTLDIVKAIGDERMIDLKDHLNAAMSEKITDLISNRKIAVAASLLTKEGYEGNTPDEKALLAKLMKHVSKHDYPVKNDDDLPFKALKTHPTGPAGDHKPAPAVDLEA